jgi:hypothetical protein
MGFGDSAIRRSLELKPAGDREVILGGQTGRRDTKVPAFASQ